jgi:predicted aconitase
MAFMTADNTLKGYLVETKEITEIRDANGAVLGYYAPASAADQVPAIRLAALFNPEELRRRKASTHPGYTFGQVMEHLRSLEPPT